ncbi:substrate-binding domain-containing protein [Streptosporangium roseum]|uniref:Nitrile hydratase regulator n=1 Tax=Streptosporangium roseum (strain ATCC 12428 / DSM 43021 / JCM 3005 / KCTC 9067 / NCIMB 10171 / NRRL 2505 / NI 9100) TaxID=479432 RepID=D2AZR0_STRRD|nr:substrate-binding domain-containing protein [Streptosporangium roseum]ACZ85305.1 nitrile hydratase regulator [Streptosporangium roseum DSM 43021]
MAEAITPVIEPLEAELIRSHALRVGLVVPVSGVLGLVGPCAINCAILAADEVNLAGGVLGRPIELVLIDGGRAAEQVAAEVGNLAASGAIDAVVGTHGSDVRIAVVRALAGRVPFVYAPPYEGGGHSPGVYFLGETPGRQLRPGLDWLIDRRRARRWFLLGNDYIWPRLVHDAARRHLTARNVTVVGERFVPYGVRDFAPLLERLAASRPDAVLLSLIGSDLVTFNRAFTAAGLSWPRLCGALEEHGLLGIGGDATGELYGAMGYFASLVTDDSLSLGERYIRRFGAGAPLLNGHGQGCYEAVLMLAALGSRAGTLAVPAVDAIADGTSIVTARGRLTLQDRGVRRRAHIGRADGLDFDIVH